MICHVIEGGAGCTFARENDCVAIIVDALRASATLAMLCDAGAAEILAVREVETALHAKEFNQDCLLFGERGGLPPDGFDFGNSPREAVHAAGRRIIITTTTGTTRLVEACGAAGTYAGSTVNATAVVAAARQHGRNMVVIPAGLAGDETFDAQEDWTAAAVIASKAVEAGAAMGEGSTQVASWQQRIAREGLTALFSSAPHAEQLRRLRQERDIEFCSGVDVTAAVPVVVGKNRFGVEIGDARMVHRLLAKKC